MEVELGAVDPGVVVFDAQMLMQAGQAGMEQVHVCYPLLRGSPQPALAVNLCATPCLLYACSQQQAWCWGCLRNDLARKMNLIEVTYFVMFKEHRSAQTRSSVGTISQCKVRATHTSGYTTTGWTEEKRSIAHAQPRFVHAIVRPRCTNQSDSTQAYRFKGTWDITNACTSFPTLDCFGTLTGY